VVAAADPAGALRRPEQGIDLLRFKEGHVAAIGAFGRDGQPGGRDPAILADLARGRLRAKLPQLQAALAGRFSTHHAPLVSEVLSLLDYLDESIERLSAEIDG